MKRVQIDNTRREVQRLKAVFSQFKGAVEKLAGGVEYLEEQRLAEAIVFGRRFSAETVRRISKTVLRHEHGAFFVNALINTGRREDYVIETPRLGAEDDSLDYIGCKNRKTVTVNGNVGSGTFMNMSGGIATINGNAKEHLGEQMTDGRIIINGDLVYTERFFDKDGDHDKYKPGMDPHYGIVSIYGGEVHINGKIINYPVEFVQKMLDGGEVYLNGQLIAKK